MPGVARLGERTPGIRPLELPGPDLGIELVHTGGVDLHQHVVVPHLRVGHFAGAHNIRASVMIDDECLHPMFLSPLGARRNDV